MPPEVTLVPFSNAGRLAALADFFLSSMGPEGGLKLLDSAVGHATLTSNSGRMLTMLGRRRIAGETQRSPFVRQRQQKASISS